MSSTPIDTWAVDLADVTFIHPWAGSEGIMALVAIVLWLLWHVWQIRHEAKEFQDELDKYGTPENIKNAIDGG